MGDAKVEAIIRPVSVTSLDLPEGVRTEISKIAEKEGSQSDLDTAEELRAAAEALQQIRTKSTVALPKLNPAVQISNDRITIQEDTGQYEYSIQTPKEGFFESSDGFLFRRNVETGDVKEIRQENRRGCKSNGGAIKQIAIGGGELYVLFSTSNKRLFGKVVTNERGDRAIQFANLAESDWAIREFVEENGRLAVKTVNDKIPGGAPVLVGRFILGAKKLSFCP
ncbi:MAG: hypothetical protein HY877_04740 [Deltaproteobacteria bacterium]|nr:hypothetical protein [Deltaproteobacteria bacterium]